MSAVESSLQGLVDAATHFYRLGWMMGTAGNLSHRHDAESFWITASGKSKGALTPADFLRVDLDGRVLELRSPGLKPSAETSLHQVLYRRFPAAGAIYHVHSVEANVASNFTGGTTLALPPLEMLKGFGIMEEAPDVRLDVFRNHADVPAIAEEIGGRYGAAEPRVPALLIRNHGITVWGPTPERARNHVELIEFIFRFMVAARSARVPQPADA